MKIVSLLCKLIQFLMVALSAAVHKALILLAFLNHPYQSLVFSRRFGLFSIIPTCLRNLSLVSRSANFGQFFVHLGPFFAFFSLFSVVSELLSSFWPRSLSSLSREIRVYERLGVMRTVSEISQVACGGGFVSQTETHYCG